jgi:hypothetical protein
MEVRDPAGRTWIVRRRLRPVGRWTVTAESGAHRHVLPARGRRGATAVSRGVVTSIRRGAPPFDAAERSSSHVRVLERRG